MINTNPTTATVNDRQRAETTRLTVYVTEPATASATGFYDIRARKWSDTILDTLNLERSILPEISWAGEVVGNVTAKGKNECNLPEGTPVIQGGTDTHCALITAQAKTNEIGIIAGSTTPVMLLTDQLVCDKQMRVWSGHHMIPSMYTIESNATLTGAYLEWVVGLLCERSSDSAKCVERTFNELEVLIEDIPPGSNESTVALGPNIMDSTKITNVPLARMFFPQPALPSVIPLDSGALIHAVMENIAYS
ncbi:MAG: FGGY family carbohydrate kinase [Candidatus Thorarchaeota archaeon]|nr:FGGY family carbohydrate kinase [Candidatus Thorarchaeota archaeon]